MRAGLRQATADAHLRVEATAWSRAFASGQLSVEGLAHGLALWRDVYDAVEARGPTLPAPWQPVWTGALARSAQARADLQTLAMDPQTPSGPVVRLVHDTPAAQFTGLLYVVAGSALGGRVLAEHARAAAGVPLAFYADDPEAPRAFGRFLERLESAAPPGSAPAIQAGAIDAFDAIESVLAGLPT